MPETVGAGEGVWEAAERGVAADDVRAPTTSRSTATELRALGTRSRRQGLTRRGTTRRILKSAGGETDTAAPLEADLV